MAQAPKGKQQGTGQPDTPPPRRNRADAVARDAGNIGYNAFARAGFADPTLVLRWDEIAGPDVAALARPVRLSEGASGGVLTLKAEPAASLFLQHESRALCDRINAWLGRPAIARLRFVQGPLAPRPRQPAKPRPKGQAQPGDPVHNFQGPEGLKAALLDLANARMRPRGD
ncbi:MAG TPA: DciA family protein [Rhizomicrobium sp.]|jgi:hypothetical protein